MPAVSKAQQRFMGMVYAAKKGEMKNPSPEVADAAASMKKKDAKDFASTKHKGLPEKKEVKEEDNYSQKKKELKKTAPPRNKRFKELHSGTNTAGNTDVNEMKGYGEERFCELCGKKEYREECSYGPKMWDMFTVKNFSKSVVVPGKATYEQTMTDHSNWRKEISEGSLHKWFKGSKSKDGKGGWVNVVTGGTCASDEPGEGTPKCVSSSKRASMSKSERLSAARRKKKADPGQQQKSGAAKPTYVATDKKKKKDVNETYLRIQERGKTYTIVLNWRGKTITTQMFFANFNRPAKEEVVKEIRKIYPNAMVLYYNPVRRDPTLPLLFAGEPNESR